MIDLSVFYFDATPSGGKKIELTTTRTFLLLKYVIKILKDINKERRVSWSRHTQILELKKRKEFSEIERKKREKSVI